MTLKGRNHDLEILAGQYLDNRARESGGFNGSLQKLNSRLIHDVKNGCV